MTEVSVSKDRAFLTRHTLRDDTNPLGISEAGIEKARLLAREDLGGLIDKALPGTVVFISGSSEEIRTQSTIQIYGDELQVMYQDRDDVVVVTRGEIEALRHEWLNGHTERTNFKRTRREVTRAVVDIVNSNPDKKVVVDFPLFVDEFSRRRWVRPEDWDKPNKDRRVLPYYNALVAAAGGSEGDEFLMHWVITGGALVDRETDELLEGPNPDIVATEYLQGLSRLRDFARKYIGDERPLITGVVGHSPSLDAFLIKYGSKNRVVNLENLSAVSGRKMIQPVELIQIDLSSSSAKTPPDVVRVVFRGKKFRAI